MPVDLFRLFPCTDDDGIETYGSVVDSFCRLPRDHIAEEVYHGEIDEEQYDKRQIIVFVVDHRVVQQQEEKEYRTTDQCAEKCLGELMEA